MKIFRNIIGVDAGLCNMGVVVFRLPDKRLVDSYLFTSKKQDTKLVAESNRARIEFLSDKLAAIIERYKPKYLVAELPTGASRNQRAAVAMSLSFSVVVLTCKRLHIKLHTVSPHALKQHVRPRAKAVSKEDVIAFVQKRIPSLSLKSFGSKKEHVADACACVDAFLAKTYGTEKN